MIGVPFRLTVGKKIKEGKVELMTRASRQSEDLALDEVVTILKVKIETATAK